MSDSGKPKAVFFDFDGTLAPGSASMSFMGYLAEINVFPKTQHNIALQAVEGYKNGEVSYSELCVSIGKAMAGGLEGKEETWIRYHAKQVFSVSALGIYDSSYALVKLFEVNHYTPIIVSSGSHEMNSLAAKALGVRELYCSELEIKNGRYTGQIKTDRSLADMKADVITAMRSRFDLGRSFAFGDSVADEKVMNHVGNPVALNAGMHLAAIARDRKWEVCTHEDVVNRVRHMLANGRRKTKR